MSPGFDDAALDVHSARGSAFAEHGEPENDGLLWVARTVTGSWVDAEDLVQDTLIRAYRALNSFDGAHLRAWLLTILRNTNINSRRRPRPDLLDDPDGVERHTSAFGASETSSPERSFTDRELGEDLHRAVAALDPKLGTVLLPVDVNDLELCRRTRHRGRDRDISVAPRPHTTALRPQRHRSIQEEQLMSMLSTMWTCHWVGRRIQRYLDADPSAVSTAQEVHRLETPMATCARCSAAVEDYRGIRRALATWAQRRTPDPVLVSLVRDAARHVIAEDAG